MRHSDKNSSCRQKDGPTPVGYVERHWKEFIRIAFEPQGTVGSVPRKWAIRRLENVPSPNAIPCRQLERNEARAFCTDSTNNVLHGYICAMAWGGQRFHATTAWQHRDRLRKHLKRLRKGDLTRCKAYELFCGKGQIRGLGPSYFTKLIAFFSPGTNFYIMDQWTAKSINLLAGRCVVKIVGDSPCAANTGQNYEEFCCEIDEIARRIGCAGVKVEQRLFSRGGRNPGEWRNYVRENYRACSPR
jgi:Putative 8-oxoguanine DNA glycosylase OGG-like protein